MKKLQILRITAVTVLGLGLGTGVASAHDASIDNTGPDSHNTIRANRDVEVDLDNDTDLDVRNDNEQRAYSGDATVRHNTTGGDAETGDAMNDNWTEVDAWVDNSGSSAAALGAGAESGSWSGSIDTTGPDSHNAIHLNSEMDVDVSNDTDIEVTNDNYQSATSGDARVSDNTTGGDATSGDASNINTTEVTLRVSN